MSNRRLSQTLQYRLIVFGVLISCIPSQVFAAVPATYHLSENTILTVDPRAKDVACTASEGGETATKSLEEYIDKYGQMAFNTGAKYKIPYEAIIAQSVLESTGGKSQLTQKAYNFFGIKTGSSWTGEVITMMTNEEENGVLVPRPADFRKYSSAQAGFDGYGEFITTNERYKPALQYPGDPVAYITAIKKAGYATDSSYVTKNVDIQKKVIAYIRSKNLFPPSSEVNGTSAVTPTSTSGGDSCASASSGAGSAQSIVEKAKAELKLSPVEFDKNVLKYTDGNREDWCADFVSWIYKESGLAFTGAPHSGGWRESYTPNLKAAAVVKRYGLRYFKPAQEQPQPGDIAFYRGSERINHVNIVIEVLDGGKKMKVIGGNQSDKVTQYTQSTSLGDQGLDGFARSIKL